MMSQRKVDTRERKKDGEIEKMREEGKHFLNNIRS